MKIKSNYKPIFYYSVMTGNRGDMAIRESIVRAIKEQLNIPFAYFNLKYEELTEDRILHQVNKEASALMIAGSGLYTNYPTSSGWYFPCNTKLFNKIEVPIMLVGLGNNKNLKGNILNKPLKKSTKLSIKKINQLAKISTVRDQRTYDLLDNIGVSNHDICLDPASFLRVPKVPKENKVAINIAQHSPLLGRFDGGDKGRAMREKHLNYFVEISRYLFAKNYQVVFIAHDALEQSAIDDLQKKEPRIQALNTDNIDDILTEYAKCKFSIGMKMHSNILSFASGTPFISLYYDVKSIEYLKLLMDEEFGQSIFDFKFEEIQDMINNLINNNNKLCNNIQKKKEFHGQVFYKIIKDICDIIQNNHS